MSQTNSTEIAWFVLSTINNLSAPKSGCEICKPLLTGNQAIDVLLNQTSAMMLEVMFKQEVIVADSPFTYESHIRGLTEHGKQMLALLVSYRSTK